MVRVLVQDLEPAIDIVIPGLGHFVSNRVVVGEQFFEGYARQVDDFRPYRVPKLVP